jgi:uncharacterized protein
MYWVKRFLLLAASLPAVTILFVGCGTTPAVRYYTLNAVEPSCVVSVDNSDDRLFRTVGIGPIDIPDYLERPHIVARNGENETMMAEYDRWAGSLKQDVSRVLTEDISYCLPPSLSVVSWKRTIPIDYRVSVDITRLDITPKKGVVLAAQWAVFVRNKKEPQTIRNERFIEAISNSDFGAMASAASRTVSQMGERIASDILRVAREQEKKAGP